MPIEMDSSEPGNPYPGERIYVVEYIRNMASGKRLYARVEMTEWNVKELFLDGSKFQYVVLSVTLKEPDRKQYEKDCYNRSDGSQWNWKQKELSEYQE